VSQEALASDRASLLDFASGVPANSTDADPPPLALVSGMSAKALRPPVPPTRIIGRDNEVAEIRALLDPLTG
jgi:hypothetical protein